MKIVSLLLLSLLFSVTPALADPGFDEKYKCDYNFFNPANSYAYDNPLNSVNRCNPPRCCTSELSAKTYSLNWNLQPDHSGLDGR